MDISKEELKEAIEKKTKFSDVVIGLLSLASTISLFAGIIQLNLRLTIGSILATMLVGYLKKELQKKKQELIEKWVEEHDEKRV